MSERTKILDPSTYTSDFTIGIAVSSDGSEEGKAEAMEIIRDWAAKEGVDLPIQPTKEKQDDE